MKQLIQSLRTGQLDLIDAPIPTSKAHHVVVQSKCSLVSSGTEKMLMEFGSSSFYKKAKSQPEKLKQVLDKAKADGILPTIDTVLNKLNTPIPLGYCSVGVITEVGAKVHKLNIGDRVVTNGHHAEYNLVSENLCSKIPDGVSDLDAVYTVLAAIALQGVRLAEPTIGETAVVVGMGLIGILTSQILLANGCKVIGIDLNSERLALAKSFGVQIVKPESNLDLVGQVLSMNRDQGIDLAIITTATNSSDPIKNATEMCRQRGRVILTGVAGLNFDRNWFYKKEISFSVSCSYGPGRYDHNYESKGFDYPIGFVRWTEQRNFDAILQLMNSNSISLDKLTSHYFDFKDALQAYNALKNDKSSFGIILTYSGKTADVDDYKNIPCLKQVNQHNVRIDNKEPTIALIGAGNYAANILIPTLKKQNVSIKTVCSQSGLTAALTRKKNDIEHAVSDTALIFQDEEVDGVIIASRHDSHSDLICEAIKASKHVYVEKPMVLSRVQLENVIEAYNASNNSGVLMTGYNRRWAPHSQYLKKEILNSQSIKCINITVNSGFIPNDHWIHDPYVGGGRLIGEACHFVDLCRYYTDSEISSFSVKYADTKQRDSFSINMTHLDGSLSNINYFTNGSKRHNKERIELYCDGNVGIIDNWRNCTLFKGSEKKSYNLWRQDKGVRNCLDTFIASIKNSKYRPVSVEEQIKTMDIILQMGEVNVG